MTVQKYYTCRTKFSKFSTKNSTITFGETLEQYFRFLKFDEKFYESKMLFVVNFEKILRKYVENSGKDSKKPIFVETLEKIWRKIEGIPNCCVANFEKIF